MHSHGSGFYKPRSDRGVYMNSQEPDRMKKWITAILMETMIWQMA